MRSNNCRQKQMPDEDTDPLDQVATDDSIYAAVANKDGAFIIDRNGSKDLPDIHALSEQTDPITSTQRRGFRERDERYWLVGQSYANGDFQVWVPTTNAELLVESRMRIETNDSYTIGHSLSQPWIDELYVCSHSDLVDHCDEFNLSYNDPADGQQFEDRGNVLADDNGPTPDRRPEYGERMTIRGEYLHGTDPDSGDNWEVFVPVDEARVTEIGSSNTVRVESTPNALFRRRHDRQVDSVIDQQNGLYCRQLMLVDEPMVPDVDEDTDDVVELASGALGQSNVDLIGSQ